jgi:Tfp pilus assembly protein PilV
MTATAHTRSVTRHLVRRLACDRGFTLVELLVASVVLIVGMLGVLVLLTGALQMTATNNERVGATNLARELVEATRSLDYADMTGSRVQTRLQARGLGSGSPWVIERRYAHYTVAAVSCTYDSPTDGLAAVAPDGVCLPRPAGTVGDANGDDFRRTTFSISWAGGGTSRPVSQTTLVVNPSGGLGPRILGASPIAQTITSNLTEAQVVWTTTTARTLRWTVDDGKSSGAVTGSTAFTTQWALGSPGSGSEVLDGSYEITGQPFDDRDVAGEAKRVNVVINRRLPYAPPSLAGGHDTRVDDWVDLEWGRSRERDVLGYRASWAGTDGAAGTGDDEQVCPAAGDGWMLDPAVTSCTDFSPPAGAATYYVAAVDRAPDNALREGDRRTLAITAPTPRPSPPIGLVSSTVAGEPTLVWLPPLTGGVSFYRIYRDDERYDRTSAGSLIYHDSNPGMEQHRYAITAVNSSYNESTVLGPVLWTP